MWKTRVTVVVKANDIHTPSGNPGGNLLQLVEIQDQNPVGDISTGRSIRTLWKCGKAKPNLQAEKNLAENYTVEKIRSKPDLTTCTDCPLDR
jgi:hypothetical protein